MTAELGYWSLEERTRTETERGESLRRLAFVAVLGIGSALVAEALLALADGVHANGIASDLAGAAAAVLVLSGIALLARTKPGDD